LRIPLRIRIEIVGGFFLAGTASVHNSPQDGSLVLQYQGQPIERMNVFPTGAHANPMERQLPRGMRGLTLPSRQHRYHAWALNRRWPRAAGDNPPVAEAIDANICNFEMAIQYFLQRVRISGDLPPPRYEPRLNL
jgi:hypothetical protein